MLTNVGLVCGLDIKFLFNLLSQLYHVAMEGEGGQSLS